MKHFLVYRPDYEHLRCKCGEYIRSVGGPLFECDRCGKEYPLYQLEYDRLMINDKTGWIFPVRDKERYER